MRGCYALLIELTESKGISVGKLGEFTFPKGSYVYVGSAMNGVESRIRYHLKKLKRPHWHIDYLLKQASVRRIAVYQTQERLECPIARALSQDFPSIPGFGSSDCKCRSHLFFSTEREQMNSRMISTINLLGMKPRLKTDLSVIAS